jgi:hypothetical protein
MHAHASDAALYLLLKSSLDLQTPEGHTAQPLAWQAKLPANDQRLRALRIREHQEQQLQSSLTVCHF